ncbi:MAG: hypothetical protein JWO36_5891 [Myxococcales bacterium]|nr:hypothetical protein [Myxococcales bacterium]
MSCLVLGMLTVGAAADTAKGPVATLPKLGDAFTPQGGADWPKLQWVYDSPSANDAAGKVVLHWFCTAKVAACADDLARLITLRDAGRVYIVAYIDGVERDAKKLDPIRESEGVGKGTVAYGKGVKTLIKQLGVGPGPTTIVTDVDGKVAMISPNSDAMSLDARDTKVNALIAAIKEFTTTQDGPTIAKPSEQFAMSIKIQLASWLSFSKTTPMEFKLTIPKDIKCDATALKAEQMKIEGHVLTATVNCSAPKGSYEARGDIRFGYDSPAGGAGLGNDGAKWKFEIK